MSPSEGIQNTNTNPGRFPLSVEDLSNPGVTPVRNSKSNTKNARFLVKAFEDFILPIVHAQGSGLGTANRKSNPNDDTDGVGLGPAAQQLVDALENFFTSLVSHEVTRKDEARHKEGSDILEIRRFVPSLASTIGSTQSRSLILRSKAPDRPRLLTLALEAARHRVFNKMPIRLLSFKSDGSGIKLLDKSDTWDYISTLIEARFNDAQMNEDIKRRNYPVYNPGAEGEIIDHYISLYTHYAILSHTWRRDKPGEVTYGDWNSGNIDTDSPGYQKLSTFCKVAAEDHGVTLAWMDTVCINKDSSAELDESIRSMFQWYRGASICITYLAQTTTLADMDKDAWFTRGWTLQELLAPQDIKFYDTDWKKLTSDKNDKENSRVQTKISAATTITSDELRNMWAPVSRKMQWAANRRVTREEDTAYSLMGIFDASFSIAYGEGAERAFFRLAQQILNSTAAVQDIINWGYGPDLTHNTDDTRISSLIPSKPQQYLWRAANITGWPISSIPVTLTHLGLHLSVLLMPAISAGDPNIHPFHSIGGFYGSATFDAAVVDLDAQNGISPGQRYNVLDKASQHPTDSNTVANRHQITFGVLNFGATESRVFFQTLDESRIPCFAVALSYNKSTYSSLTDAAATKAVQVLRSQTAIAFDLLTHLNIISPLPPWFDIPKKDLARHGMQLLDMYL